MISILFFPKDGFHLVIFSTIYFCRIFHVEKLMNTNLVFIMVESKGTCPCDTRLLMQAEQTCILWCKGCLEEIILKQ